MGGFLFGPYWTRTKGSVDVFQNIDGGFPDAASCGRNTADGKRFESSLFLQSTLHGWFFICCCHTRSEPEAPSMYGIHRWRFSGRGVLWTQNASSPFSRPLRAGFFFPCLFASCAGRDVRMRFSPDDILRAYCNPLYDMVYSIYGQIHGVSRCV